MQKKSDYFPTTFLFTLLEGEFTLHNTEPEREINSSEEGIMKSTIIKAALLLAGMGGLLLAAREDINQNWNCAPEIDGASAGTALALLGGAVVMIRGRKR